MSRVDIPAVYSEIMILRGVCQCVSVCVCVCLCVCKRERERERVESVCVCVYVCKRVCVCGDLNGVLARVYMLVYARPQWPQDSPFLSL